MFLAVLFHWMSFCNPGDDVELWRLLKMFLHLAQFRGTDQRVAVFLGEGGRDHDFKVNLFDQASERVGVCTLKDLDALRGEPALLAEPKDIDTGASSDRREENVKRRGRAAHGRLIGWVGEVSKVSIYA